MSRYGSISSLQQFYISCRSFASHADNNRPGLLVALNHCSIAADGCSSSSLQGQWAGLCKEKTSPADTTSVNAAHTNAPHQQQQLHTACHSHATASSSPAFWWLQGSGGMSQQEQQQPNYTPTHALPCPWPHVSGFGPSSPFSPSQLLLLSSFNQHAAQHQPSQLQQQRGYKSNKKSMKPVYAKASKLAVQPLLPPITPEEREKRLRYKRAPIIDTALPPIPVPPKPDALKRIGYITRGYTLDMQPKFAVVELLGKQFKVTVDDVMFIDSLSGKARINEVLSLGRVMLLGSTETTLIGRPYIPGAYVEAAVEEHFLDGKVHVFKFKKRNRYRKYAAPRPQLTTLRILKIHGLPEPALSEPGNTSSSGTAPGLGMTSDGRPQQPQWPEQPQTMQQQGAEAEGGVPAPQAKPRILRLPIKYYSEAVALQNA